MVYFMSYNVVKNLGIISKKNEALVFFGRLKKNTSNNILEICNINQKNYQDNDMVLKIIWKYKLKQFSGCSKKMQDIFKIIYSMEHIERYFVCKERKNFLNCLKKNKFMWAIKSAYYILSSYFNKKKKRRRLINLWRDIDYEGDYNDTIYLEQAIKKVSDPEKKSVITYLLSKIKDRKMKKRLEQLGKTPNQLDLLLQQCKKWQIMLTNGLNINGGSWFFKELTQTVSGSRRCHSLIISNVVKNKKWIVKDLKVIQSTLDGWVHEISFKKYIKENYSESDFLVASFPKNKIDPIILNAKNHIWEKYNKLSMLLDVISGWDIKFFNKDIQNINKTYCTALIFDAMEKSNCNIPMYHLTPADILLTDGLVPEYACYCHEI